MQAESSCLKNLLLWLILFLQFFEDWLAPISAFLAFGPHSWASSECYSLEMTAWSQCVLTQQKYWMASEERSKWCHGVLAWVGGLMRLRLQTTICMACNKNTTGQKATGKPSQWHLFRKEKQSTISGLCSAWNRVHWMPSSARKVTGDNLVRIHRPGRNTDPALCSIFYQLSICRTHDDKSLSAETYILFKYPWCYVHIISLLHNNKNENKPYTDCSLCSSSHFACKTSSDSPIKKKRAFESHCSNLSLHFMAIAHNHFTKHFVKVWRHSF